MITPEEVVAAIEMLMRIDARTERIERPVEDDDGWEEQED